jgi:transcription elongation factor Elf1
MPHPAVLKEQTQQQSEKRDGCPNCGSVNLSTVATGAPNGLLMNCQDCDHFFRADAPDVQYPNPAMSQPSTELPPLMVMNTSDESVSIVSCPVCGSDQVMIDSRERDDATRLGCMDCDARWFVRHPDDDSDVEPTKQRPGDQPLPVTNDHPFVADALCSFIEARKQVGIERYGTPLQPNNGRDAIRDAFEEAVDLATYLAQVIIERDGSL